MIEHNLFNFVCKRYTFKYNKSVIDGIFKGIVKIDNYHYMAFSNVFQNNLSIPPNIFVCVHPKDTKCINTDGFNKLRKICRDIFTNKNWELRNNKIFYPMSSIYRIIPKVKYL